MKVKTRDELITALAGRQKTTRKTAGASLDWVLDQVLVVAVPRLQHEWDGSQVLQQIYRWKGTR